MCFISNFCLVSGISQLILCSDVGAQNNRVAVTSADVASGSKTVIARNAGTKIYIRLYLP